MKLSKKLIFTIWSLLLLIALVACGGNKTSIDSDKKSNSEIAQGVADDEIIVGQIGPQTGPVAIYDSFRKGIQAHFDYVNENGGVNGRKLKLIAYDDQYQPSQTIQGVKKLVDEDKVFSLLMPIGTAPISAAAPFLIESGIPVVGVGSGADMFVNPPIQNFFITVFNASIEAKMLTNYAYEKLNAKKIAVVFQNDELGKQPLEVVREAIKDYEGLEISAEIPFLPTDTDFSSHMQKILNSDPDTIIMFGTPAPAANLRKEMNKINATDIPFLVSQNGGADESMFEIAGKEIWEGTISASPLPLESSDIPGYDIYAERIIKDFGKDEIGAMTMTGWSNAQIFVEALKRAGDDLTWENFISQLETFENWDGSFFPSVTYTSEHRYGITTLFVFEAKDGKRSLLHKVHYDPETEEITYD